MIKKEEPELMEMFHNWPAHAMGVRHMLSSTVDAYERKLKEAAREEGRHTALLEAARKMLARGMAVEEVVAVPELPREEVEKLAGEIRTIE